MGDSSATDYPPASPPAREVTETEAETVTANDQNPIPDTNPPPPPPPGDNAPDEVQERVNMQAFHLTCVDANGVLFTLDLNGEPIESVTEFFCTACMSFAAVMIAGLVLARF